MIVEQDLVGNVIAVTGANGFVGRSVLAEIQRRGGTPIGLVRDDRAAEACGAQTVRIIGNIDGRTHWQASLEGCDCVIHLAARVHVMAENATDPLAAFRRVNRDGSRRLAQECADAGVTRLVLASSIKVNGEETPYEPGNGRDVPFTEKDDAAPLDDYGLSKHEAEQAVFEIAATTELEAAIVRPPLVYGPGVGGNMHRLLGLVQRGIPLPFGAIDNKRSLIGVRNLASLLIAAGMHPKAAGRTFLAADGSDLSTADLVRALARVLDRPARLLPVPVAILRLLGTLTGKSAEIDRLTKSLRVDAGASRRELGWSPPVSLEEGFRRMADHFLKSD